MSDGRIVRSSGIANQYGEVQLFERDGQFFVHLDNCDAGSDLWGPLTPAQVDALHQLCDLPDGGRA